MKTSGRWIKLKKHRASLNRTSIKSTSFKGAVLGLLTASLFTVAGCSDSEVGDVSLGLFTTKDIKIDALQDPVVTGVTCHISSIEANLDLSDPSDSSIACRQTGPITAEMLAAIDKSDSGEVIFKKSKSVFFKNMKLRRIYDADAKTLIYLSYSTKETSGSYKHSLSTVPLWETLAFKNSA